jgi:translation initiation factor IF-3
LSRPFFSRSSGPAASFTRINGKIRAREVRVVDEEGGQLGVITLNEALAMARQRGVDLVEIAANATPPVCKLIDFGKYRYEQSKKEKESKKHQHAGKVKEIQLSPTIDSHDFGVKLQHAIDFLCEDMKVKIALRFRGREMAHTEFGFQQVNKFIKSLALWGHPDNQPKLIGRGINVMVSPLPRNKRAKNPNESGSNAAHEDEETDKAPAPQRPQKKTVPTTAAENPSSTAFANNPFTQLDPQTKQ